MDRFLHLFGLQGQSFLPMMLGFGCTVPAILASRSLKNPKDRIATVLVTPFMSCGAKLPVYVLLAGTFFPAQAGTAVLSIYLLGVLLALASAWLLRKTVLRGDAAPFIMELPPYRLPTVRGMAQHVGAKSFQYFKKAGTVILAASVLIWAVTTFPSAPSGATPEQALEASAAGWIGKAIEPAVRPLGFDWKVGIATVTGFAAKETVVSTLGVLYHVGDDQPLRAALETDPAFNPLAAYTLMLFTLILAPCLAAQAAMRAELGTRWLAFYLAASTALSWLLCFAVYQIGSLLHLGVS
jgi:ferrous iron transport protein B